MNKALLLVNPNVDEMNTAVAAVVVHLNRMSELILAGNADALGELISDDFIAADPSNKVRTREDLVNLVSSKRLVYTSVEVEIDAAKQLGADLVVLMGTESTNQDAVPTSGALATSALAGTLYRRFTNVYRREGGHWKLLVKQSTIVSMD